MQSSPLLMLELLPLAISGQYEPQDSSLFYLSLALLALLRQKSPNVNRFDALKRVRTHLGQIQACGVVSNINYAAWSLLLTAELCDATDDADKAMQAYDAALAHAQEHGFVLEGALTRELAAGFYLRRGANRAAQGLIKEAILGYRRIDALGKAAHVQEKYSSLLTDNMRPWLVDVACQTDYVEDASSNQFRMLAVEDNEWQITDNQGVQSTQDRTRNWVTPGAANEKNEVPGLGIDVIDLQSKYCHYTPKVV